MGCGEQVTNWHYFIQSSFALHSLHFELSHISLSVSLDSLWYHLFLRQSSITVHVWVGQLGNHKLKYVKYFKEPIIKENDRKTSFLTDLFSRSRYKGYNFLMEDTRKGYLLSKIVCLRVRDWTSGRSLSEQSFIEQPPTPPLPSLFSVELSTSCSPTFWQLVVFRATFFVSSNFLHNF